MGLGLGLRLLLLLLGDETSLVGFDALFKERHDRILVAFSDEVVHSHLTRRKEKEKAR